MAKGAAYRSTGARNALSASPAARSRSTQVPRSAENWVYPPASKQLGQARDDRVGVVRWRGPGAGERRAEPVEAVEAEATEAAVHPGTDSAERGDRPQRDSGHLGDVAGRDVGTVVEHADQEGPLG